jgi:hypothetical protein
LSGAFLTDCDLKATLTFLGATTTGPKLNLLRQQETQTNDRRRSSIPRGSVSAYRKLATLPARSAMPSRRSPAYACASCRSRRSACAGRSGRSHVAGWRTFRDNPVREDRQNRGGRSHATQHHTTNALIQHFERIVRPTYRVLTTQAVQLAAMLTMPVSIFSGVRSTRDGAFTRGRARLKRGRPGGKRTLRWGLCAQASHCGKAVRPSGRRYNGTQWPNL